MSEFIVIKEQIKVLQAELNKMIENLDRERVVSKEVTVISEKLDELIVELHRLA